MRTTLTAVLALALPALGAAGCAQGYSGPAETLVQLADRPVGGTSGGATRIDESFEVHVDDDAPRNTLLRCPPGPWLASGCRDGYRVALLPGPVQALATGDGSLRLTAHDGGRWLLLDPAAARIVAGHSDGGEVAAFVVGGLLVAGGIGALIWFVLHPMSSILGP